ncbi:hypothetical protein N7537_011386 [Penicillium hordei]|uniref:Uncharacterized protein n=1 Tax=Penicillium hordei TaxID=40994 RepID=A0AAD6DLN8_9EURO|nr:uncharacterized protein N7537_011386 [Penicillium hordei]KAJ5588708.1 hypothetical protein N7537_011386 [Penicillium hordei]
MANSLCSDDAYQTRTGDPWDDYSQYAPTPGYFGRSPTIFSPSPAPDCATDQVQSDQLDFLPLAEWDEDAEYDEQLPTHMRYTIAWKVMFNRKKVGSVTEKDLVVSPADYWVKTLKLAVEEMLQMKKKNGQRVRSEGTAVTVKVDSRCQKNLERFFPSTIDWKPVEKQLRKWSNLIRVGKILTIEIVFNYRGDDDGPSMSVSRTGEKRGRVSATSRMLAERERLIHNEEENTGRPATWDLVYGFMRCDVRSCPLKSDWCWEDPKDKKHYKMRAPHLERLIDYVDGGGSLDSHDDVPSDIRRDLVLESQTGRKSKKTDNLTTGPPYPTIINVLPAQNRVAPAVTSSVRRLPPDDYVVIPGSREAAVREYCKWLESRATDEAYKADFRKICQVTLENHLDLELILEDPDSGFFVQRGIQIGTARRFLRDINEWATVRKSNGLD